MSRIPKIGAALLVGATMLAGTGAAQAQTSGHPAHAHAQSQMWQQHLQNLHMLYQNWLAQQPAQQSGSNQPTATHHGHAHQHALSQQTSPQSGQTQTSTTGALAQTTPTTQQTFAAQNQAKCTGTQTAQAATLFSPANSRFHAHQQTALSQTGTASPQDPAATTQQCQQQQNLLVRQQTTTSVTIVAVNAGQQDPKRHHASNTKQQCLQQQSLLNRQDPSATPSTTQAQAQTQQQPTVTTTPTQPTQQLTQQTATAQPTQQSSVPLLQYSQPTASTQQYQQPVTPPVPLSQQTQPLSATQGQPTQQYGLIGQQPAQSSSLQTGSTGQSCNSTQGSPLYYDAFTKNVMNYMQMGALTYVNIMNTQTMQEILNALPSSSSSAASQQSYVAPQQTTQN